MKVPLKDETLVEKSGQIVEGLVQTAAINMLPPDLATLLGNDLATFERAMADHEEAKSAVRASQLAKRIVLKRVRAHLALATQMLKPHLGGRTNGDWARLGMPQGSLANVRLLDEIPTRLNGLRDHLTAMPAHEVASLSITAEETAALARAYAETTTALNRALTVSRNLAVQRAEAGQALRQRFRATVEVIATKVGPDDNLWYTFGLNRPVDIRIPEVPAQPQVAQTGPGAVQVTFAKAKRARSYRVFVQAPGDEEPTVVETVRDPVAILKDLPSGVVLKVSLTAVNSSGVSLMGEAAEITLQ